MKTESRRSESNVQITLFALVNIRIGAVYE